MENLKKVIGAFIFLVILSQAGSTEGILKAEGNPMLEKAIFAGGCFWSLESAFEKIPGVQEAVSGYTGGHKENPTYEEVSSRQTGHRESVQVTYDPKVVSYEQLLDVFWRNIDPTDPDGQFFDQGSEYQTAIFYQDEKQKKAA